MKMMIKKSDRSGCEDATEEYSVPIRGFLLRAGRLIGIYLKDGMMPVDREIPKDVNEDILNGRVRKILLVREVLKGSLCLLEAYINDDGRKWLVHSAPITADKRE